MVTSMMVRAVCFIGLLCLGHFLQSSSAAFISRNNFKLNNFLDSPRDFTCRSFQSNGNVVEVKSGRRRVVGCYEYTCPASGLMQRRKTDSPFTEC